METMEYEDLSEKVYKALKEMILKGELEPDQKLVQEDLSERMGVSRTPLLAAFSKLEKEMLIELVPRRGAFVRKCSLPELLNFYDIRLRLEPLGARGAAAAATPATIGPLADALAAYAEVAARTGSAGVREADYAFHMEIMSLSGNPVLLQIVSSSNIVMISNQRGLLKDASRSLAEHRALFAAIAAKRQDEAEALMYEHLKGPRQRLIDQIAAGPPA